MAWASEYPFVVEILTPTQPTFPPRLGWGEFVPGELSYAQRVSAAGRASFPAINHIS